MAFKTKFGKCYHERENCCGATEIISTITGLKPCSYCCSVGTGREASSIGGMPSQTSDTSSGAGTLTPDTTTEVDGEEKPSQGTTTSPLIACDFKAEKARHNRKVTEEAEKDVADARKAASETAAGGTTSREDMLRAALSSMDADRKEHFGGIARRLGQDIDEVIGHIVDGNASSFDLCELVAMKAASRTGWQEEHQADVISHHSQLISNFVVLPKSATKSKVAKWLSGGKVVTKKPTEGKTIDFEGSIGNMRVVIAAKHTVGSGGSQDNQRLDLLSFGDEAPAIGNEPLVILLADGSHYPDGFHKEQTDKFRAAGKNVIVTDTAGFDKAVAAVISTLPSHGPLTDLPTDFAKAQSDREEEIRTELHAWHDSMCEKVKGKAKEDVDWGRLLDSIRLGRGKPKNLQDEDKNRHRRILSCAENLDIAPTDLLAQMLGFGDAGETFATLAMRKQASRTGWQEDYQFSVLHNGSTTVALPEKSLPKDGPSSRYLLNGKVVDKRPARSKSLDFRGTLRSNPSQDVVMAAKYAEIGGGGQDNQYADLKKFGHNAPPLGSNGPLVVLLADGDYYTGTTRKRPVSRIAEMREMFKEKNVIVTDSAHLDQEVTAWEKRIADLSASSS